MNSISTISFLASLLYCSATGLQFSYLFNKLLLSKAKWIALIFVAVILHAYLLYRWIDTPFGQNLSPSHLFSLVCWLISLTTLLTSLRKPIENLMLFVLPLTAGSILLSLLFPGDTLLQTREHPATLFHILMSILAFGILGMATLQAMFLSLQHQCLKNRASHRLMRFFPPLETMEKLLFQIIGIGFFLLSVSLLSVLLLPDFLVTSRLQKILFSLLAWSLFALLLAGHHHSGLRGQKATHWTLGGMGLLSLAYLAGKWIPMETLQ